MAPRERVDLRCYVDTDDVVGVAAAYDEVTATRLDIAGIDETRRHVSVAGWPTSDALFRLESGPLAGRQELCTALATMARDAGASGIQVVDSGNGISFSGTASADQSGLCGTLLDRMLGAGGSFDYLPLARLINRVRPDLAAVAPTATRPHPALCRARQ